MFLGHFAVAFAARPQAGTVSLGTLFLACQLADLVWPVLVLAGVERVEIDPGNTAVTPLAFVFYPYSHSLTALAGWGLLVAAIVRRGRVAGLLVAVVISHWILDVVAHRADMPLTFDNTTRLGFGLWQSVPATIAVEGALFGLATLWYARTTRPRDRTGTRALAGLVAFLVVIYVASLFGPPPPNVTTVAVSALAMWLLVAWAYWIDRHRDVRGPRSTGDRPEGDRPTVRPL